MTEDDRRLPIIAGSNFERSGASDQSKSATSKLGLTGYSGDKVISQRDIQRLVSHPLLAPNHPP